MSDTPIFDQLARELNYNRMVAVPAKRIPAYTGTSTTINGARPVGMYIDEWNGGQLGMSTAEAVENLRSFSRAGVQTDEAVNAAPNAPEEDEVIVFRKPIPVTTLADLAKGTHQE
jgi:hypothetical protein